MFRVSNNALKKERKVTTKDTFKIVNEIIRKGYDLVSNVDEDNYYFYKNKMNISYVTPHSGTKGNHMIRAETDENFDRWSNASYEKLFKEVDELGKVLKELEEYEK